MCLEKNVALPASSASPTVQALFLNQYLRKDPRVKKIKVSRKIIRISEMIQVTIFVKVECLPITTNAKI